MLFNSYIFIFGFLPVALAGFALLGRFSRNGAPLWLIAISVAFYAWWRPINVLLMAPSVAINYGLARLIQRLGSERPRAARSVVVVGIAANLLFLGYFKYLDFGRATVNAVLGTNLVLTHLILPLGISFITFQKIAFLVDVYAGRIKSFTLQQYTLFVLFFPQLISGPIVHFREMMPQFDKARYRLDGEDVAVAITLFSFGLLKKMVLADSIAPYVSSIYDTAAAGGSVSLIYAWMAAIGFMLQLYFDFSGYTDMALGLARFFGIKLPMNFNSPLKATSVIEFWGRWHASLTRFLTAYTFNPVLLAISRRRTAKNLPLISGANITAGAFVSLLVLPTMLTMFLSGIWHGAGWQFIVFGVLHGAYLCVNHAWRAVRPALWPNVRSYNRLAHPAAWFITFFCVVVAQVFFRSPSVGTAMTMLRGMFGSYGVALPDAILARLGGLGAHLQSVGIAAINAPGGSFLKMAAWLLVLLVIALVPPNTLQMLANYEPALGFKLRAKDTFALRLLSWRPSPGWAIGIAAISVLGVLSLGQLSTFLYWQF